MRVQVVKVAEEPLLITYATPPLCEPEKKKREKGIGEREEERNRQRRE